MGEVACTVAVVVVVLLEPAVLPIPEDACLVIRGPRTWFRLAHMPPEAARLRSSCCMRGRYALLPGGNPSRHRRDRTAGQEEAGCQAGRGWTQIQPWFWPGGATSLRFGGRRTTTHRLRGPTAAYPQEAHPTDGPNRVPLAVMTSHDVSVGQQSGGLAHLPEPEAEQRCHLLLGIVDSFDRKLDEGFPRHRDVRDRSDPPCSEVLDRPGVGHRDVSPLLNLPLATPRALDDHRVTGRWERGEGPYRVANERPLACLSGVVEAEAVAHLHGAKTRPSAA